jgi:hypothetical protein
MAHETVIRPGTHISQAIGSQMAVRLSALQSRILKEESEERLRLFRDFSRILHYVRERELSH